MNTVPRVKNEAGRESQQLDAFKGKTVNRKLMLEHSFKVDFEKKKGVLL